MKAELVKHAVFLVTAALVAFTFIAPPRTAARTGPVADALRAAASSDRAEISRFYGSLADITRRDGGVQIATTAEWRQVHMSALKLWLWSSGKVGKFPGLDRAVDDVLLAGLGKDVVAMNSPAGDKKRYEAVADACLEVSEQSR